MKKLVAYIILGGLALPRASWAIDFKQAKFTQVVNSVEVITPDQVRHSAEVNGIFKIPDILRTGPNSRAELIASDDTITRVGANTVFSFDPASRTIDLQQGSVLFHSPHGKGGGTIHTGSATASVLGTTIIVSTTSNGGSKVMVLEGEAEIRFLNGMHATLTPGQMTFILPGGGTSPIVVFRLDKETSGSRLVNGFKNPLPSWNKIGTEVTRQLLLLLNNKLQDTGLVVGNNATPNTVQVRMDILNGQQSPFATDGSIVGADHTPNQPASVNYPPLDMSHVETGSFTPPVLNSNPALDSFNQGLLFLGIVNPITGGLPASGFVGNNVNIDTANVNLSSFASQPDFDVMAVNDLKIWQSVDFTPNFVGNGDGSGGVITVSALSPASGQPDTIALFAGAQMLIAPNSTLEADTKLFGLVADSFGALDTTTGSADSDYPNTLLDVSLINQVGDVDVLSLSDLTIEGMNSSYTVEAAGDVNIESDGKLTLGAMPSINALDNGHDVSIESDSSVYLTAQNDLDLYDAEVVAEYGDIGLGGNVVLNSISGNINVEDNSYLDATGTLSLDAADNVYVDSCNLQAGKTENMDVSAGSDIGICNSTIGAGGNVEIEAGGLVDIENSDIRQDGSVYVNAGGYVNLYNVFDDAYDGNSSETHLAGWNIIGGYVDIGADAYVTATDSRVFAKSGNVSVTSGGNLTLGDGILGSGVSIVASGAVLMSANGNVNISDSSIGAESGDAIISAKGALSVDGGLNFNSISGDNVVLSGLNGVSISGEQITANNGDLTINAGSSHEEPVSAGENIISAAKIPNTSAGNTSPAGVDIYSLNPIGDTGDVSITIENVKDIDLENQTITDPDSITDPGSIDLIAGDTITINNSSLTDNGGHIRISGGGAVNISGSGIYANAGYADITSSGNTVDIDDSSIDASGDASIESSGTLTIQDNSTIESYGVNGISLTSDAANIDVNGSSINAWDGNVKIGANSGYVEIEGSSINAGSDNNLNLSGGQLSAIGDVNLNAYGGNVSISAGGEVEIIGSTINLGGDISIDGSQITAGSGETSGGSLNITTGSALSISGDYVSLDYLQTSGNNILISGGASLTANNGSVDIANYGSASILWNSGVSYLNSSVDVNNITVQSSTISANNGNINIEDLGMVSLPVAPESSSVTASQILISDSKMAANSGDVTISTSGTIDIFNSDIGATLGGNGGGNVTVNAGAGITVKGSSLGGDSEAGTIALNNTSGQTTIENGSSVQAFYLSVNSSDGILIDGTSGGSLKGNTMKLTASSTLGQGSGITVENEDLSNLKIVNALSHTVNFDNDNLSSLSSYNLTSWYGGFYIDDGHQAGYVNFNNDTLDHNPIVNLDTPDTLNPNNNAGIGLVTSPSSSPGIHVLSASVPGVASSVSLPASSPVNAFAANFSGSNPGIRAIGH